MQVTTQYEFDNEDRRLLSIKLPDDPCKKCYLNSNGCCCGCPDGDKYANIIKPYKERNIYDIALKLKRMEALQKEISTMQKEIRCISKEIEKIGLFN